MKLIKILMILSFCLVIEGASYAADSIALPQEGQKLVCDVTAKEYCRPDGSCQIPGPLNGSADIIAYDGKSGPFGLGGPQYKLSEDVIDFNGDLTQNSRSVNQLRLAASHFDWDSLGKDSVTLTLNSDGTGEIVILMDGPGLDLDVDYLLSNCGVARD